MKKNLLLALACLTLAAKPALASGGPDAYGYTWMTSLDAGGPTFNWIDITSRSGVQTVTGLADDNSAPSMIGLGINFHYYWNDYTQLKVGSNGWVSFSNVSNIASCFPPIPTAGGPDDYLAPLMGDLNFTGSGNPGQVKYWSNNVDTFIISYINVPFWSVSAPGWTGSNSFQVILCNSDSSITYQYGSLGGFNNNAACIDMTVGIENSTGSIGLQVHSDAMPPNNYAIRFKYPNPVLLSIQDILPKWNLHNDNAADFILTNTPTGLNSDIHNSGNAAVSTTINIQSAIINSASTTIQTNSGSLPSLAAGDDSVYVFPSWTPTVAGQYTNSTTTTNSQDINAANNTLNTELEVVNPCLPNMLLSYVTGNTPDGSLNWNGGANDDGAAVYFQPPVYPYAVTTLQYYISSNVSDYFIAQLVDDDGPNGGPGTVLYNVTIPSASVVSNAWNTVTLPTSVTLNNGGFYVVWLQGGTTIFLGTETAGPRSHRNYEILDAGWATLRYDDARDILIRAGITNYASSPSAAFTSAANSSTANFTDNTTGLVTSWSWDFGDSQSSTQQNPSHTYAAPGTYTVCLTATSPCTTSVVCQPVTICSIPVAAYSSAANFLDVAFTDLTTGTATSWSWDFGDGSPLDNQQNPSHTYAAAGIYTVCMIASNVCGDADTVCSTVTICAQTLAAFTDAATLLNASFTDMSSGSPVSWSWDFGDSQTSTQQNPSHTYAAGGAYTVCLVAVNSCGDADTICQLVTVCDQLVNAFSYSQNEDTVFVTDMSSGSVVSWLWDFGDAQNATTQNAVHEYTTGGLYQVCLTTTDACGNSDSTCQMVMILITSLNENAPQISGTYPNPVGNELNISFGKELKNARVEIFDAAGRMIISQQNISGKTARLDVSAIPSGIYLLRVVDEDGSSSARFIKE